MPMPADSTILDRLYQRVASRKGADPTTSYTAKLFSKGRPKIAQKVGEEATEAIVAALRSMLTDEQAYERLRAEARARPHRSWNDYAEQTWDAFGGAR